MRPFHQFPRRGALARLFLSVVTFAGGATVLVSALAAPAAAPPAADAAPWPSFRGARAEGIASDQQLPASWNGTTGEHV
jgi:hypothetical protein